MNKKLLSLTFITCALGSTIFAVHEIRTPLCLTSKLNVINGSFHYPIRPVDEEKTNIDIWAGAYYRSACKGYCPKKCDWCCSIDNDNCLTCVNDTCCNSCTSGVSACSSCGCNNNEICAGSTNYLGCTSCPNKKVPLAKLFFGKSAFTGSEAFGSGVDFTDHETLTTVVMRPKIEYTEKGVLIGMHLERKVKCTKWRIGANANLPIKIIKVTRNYDCDNCCDDTSGDNPAIPDFTDKVFYKDEILTDTLSGFGKSAMGETYAYRLDFLSSLKMPDGTTDLVTYGDGSITVAGVELVNEENKVYIPAMGYRRDSEKIDPTDPSLLAVISNQIGTALPYPDVVPADGDFTDGQKRRFGDSQDYTVLGDDTQEQEKIFIIPTYYFNADANNNLYEDARYTATTIGTLNIKNVVDSIIRGDCCGTAGDSYESPEAFFNSVGVYLCNSDCITGLGDFDTEFYVGYDFTERSYLDCVAGIKFPTGKKNRCPSRVYYMPTGNNGHFEAKIGLEGGWRSCRWFGIRADASYTHVLEAIEKKPAAFKCATIRGIGPCIDAKVKWGYFLGHLDLTVFHPENQNMGFALGYEIYYKRHDKVRFCTCAGGDRMEDFLGNIVVLDSGILERNTHILAHKLRGQVYHRWNYFELYLGATKVVGGWNGMAENEVHIGCGINF
ncbi:hypothetical protein ACFLYU_02875 [Candidatus Dependentiae bacterium]